jgi:hypothetical protein
LDRPRPSKFRYDFFPIVVRDGRFCNSLETEY